MYLILLKVWYYSAPDGKNLAPRPFNAWKRERYIVLGTYLIYQNKCTSAMNNPLKETLLSLSTFRGCIKISYHPAV